MQRRDFLKWSILAPLTAPAAAMALTDAPTPASEPIPDGHPHHFGFHVRRFVLDGRPLQIRSGQMDPIRIPRMYWRQRIRMARAMGLNTIACYLMWNALERAPGTFDLTTGRRDFAHFIRLCAEEGMWVYLRPGPYVCAEWDFGGLPPYLLRDPDMRVRDRNNARYMQAVGRYFDAIAPHLAPLMTDKGGPVLMLQVENEYASFGHDLDYLQQLRSMWRARGIDGPFALSDGLPQLRKADTYLPGAALGLDGGTDFAAAQAIAGDAPVWVGEGYTGWLTHWGDKTFQADGYAATLRKLMDAGHSFNLYEVHGGTNFGFGAGANAHNDGSHFQPVITSYDYGAPINERGVATDDYHRFRAIIAGVLRRRLPPIPPSPPVMGFAAVTPQPWASLWDNLPPPKRIDRPQTSELLFGQDHGMVLYRTSIHMDGDTHLHIAGVHDYATVFADGRYLDHVSRLHEPGLHTSGRIALPASTSAAATQVDILIDSFGHVGYGQYMHDRKGLTGDVRMDARDLGGWQAFSLPLDDAYMRRLKPLTGPATRPGIFFRAEVSMDAVADTYVDMSAWDKGYVWVNGHLLGGYWRIGPQQRLYAPASWWRRGANQILVFDQRRTTATPIRGVATLHGEAD